MLCDLDEVHNNIYGTYYLSEIKFKIQLGSFHFVTLIFFWTFTRLL